MTAPTTTVPVTRPATEPPTGPVTITVCSTCRAATDPAEGPRAGARLAAELLARAAERALSVAIVPVECLSVCKRPVTVGFSAPGKWTYVYGDFPAEAADAILDAAGQYAAAAQGLIPWRERPEALKKGVVARMPPLFPLPEAAE